MHKRMVVLLLSITLLAGCGGAGTKSQAPAAQDTKEAIPVAVNKTGTVQVQGASLYYQMRGTGPLLLVIAGGSGDADSSKSLVDILATKYTVVTYDRRGYARSKLDDQAAPLKLATEADDAHQLLAALGKEPAYVLGSSIGADIALDLATRYPGQVRTVVAHEPPAIYLTMAKGNGQQGAIQNVKDTLNKDGAQAAMKQFAEQVGVNTSNLQPGGNPSPEQTANVKFFVNKEVPMLAAYRFDFDAMKAASAKTRIVIGSGADSPKDSIGYMGAMVISDKLGAAPVQFPGDHAGMAANPQEFAAKLAEALGK